MKINGNEIRPGNVVQHKGGLWVAVKTQAVKPGKGGAFNQVELKNLIEGTKLNERFRASETVERVRLEQDDFQFLYARSEEHTSELQSLAYLVCRLLLDTKNYNY